MTTSILSRPWRIARAAGLAALSVVVCLSAGSTMLRAYVITAPSMEGSLRVGDHILVNKLAKGTEIGRGDLVVFRFPEDRNQTFVKRVIGVPGDRVRLAGKEVIRNGRRLEEPYVLHEAWSSETYRDNFPSSPPAAPPLMSGGTEMLAHNLADGEVIVPEGSLFVLGDNRDISLDSRYWGFLPVQDVIGKPVMVYWSYDAPTQDLMEWNSRHFVDVAEHFFSKTRWKRTLMMLGAGEARQ
jgi:signal peptidase I